ncbi:MAG: tetratricopeptide repeat protein [Candidatus Hodarchaeales archaeon]
MSQERFYFSLSKAREQTNRCNYKKARKLLDELVARTAGKNQSPEARYYLNLEFFYLYSSQRDLLNCEYCVNQAFELTADDITYAWSKLIKGTLDLRKKDFNEALTPLKESLSIFRKLKIFEGIIEAIGALAKVFRGLGDYDQAVELLGDGLDITTEHALPYLRTTLLLNLATIKLIQGQYKQSASLISEAQVISNEEEFKELLSQAYCLLGNIQYNQGDYGAALEGYQKALILSQEIASVIGMADSFQNFAVTFRQQGKSSNAVTYFQKALAAYEKLGDQFKVAEVLFNIGLLQGEQGNYPEANASFIEARSLAEQLDYKDIKIMVNSALGELALAKDDLQTAKTYILEADAGYRKLEIIDRRYADNLLLLARIQIEENDPAAQSSLTKIRSLANELNSSYLEARYFFYQGWYFHQKEMEQEAEEYYLKALALTKEIDLYFYHLGALIQLAQIEFLHYRKQSELDQKNKMQEYIEQALILSHEQEIRSVQAKIRMLRALVYSIDLDYENALKELQKVISFTLAHDLLQEHKEAKEFQRKILKASKEYQKLLKRATDDYQAVLAFGKDKKAFEENIDKYLAELNSIILGELQKG